MGNVKGLLWFAVCISLLSFLFTIPLGLWWVSLIAIAGFSFILFLAYKVNL